MLLRGGWSGVAAVLSQVPTGAYRFVQVTFREFADDRLLLRAMALTFATLLAGFPLLAIVFSLFKLFGGGEWFLTTLQPLIAENLAPGAGPVVLERISALLQAFGGKTAGSVGLVLLVLLVYGIFNAVESTFNIIWGTTSRSGVLHKLPLYWGLLTIIPVLVVSSLALTTYIKAIPLVSRAVERASALETVAGRTLPVLMMAVSLFLLYRFLPGTRVRNHAAAAGAVIAALLYEVVKAGFIVYSSKLVRYDLLYGSLAMIPSAMVWVNLSWIVVLLGVEVCFVTQHYPVLLHKRKHLRVSRRQQDALAYQMLLQVTLTFRGRRGVVTTDEWIRDYGVPPGVVHQVIDRLRQGGLLETAGAGGDELRLLRDPDYITVGEVNDILSGEALEEWNWPKEADWEWLRIWLDRQGKGGGADAGMSLGELVDLLCERIDREQQKVRGVVLETEGRNKE